MNRQDDQQLIGDIVVYRRIPPDGDHTDWDKKDENGNPLFTKGNFKDKNDELSVHIASETAPETLLKDWEGFGIVHMTIGEIRRIYAAASVPLIICRDTDEPENGHVLVCGRPTGSIKNQLKKAAKWLPGYLPKKPETT